jgi:hypothetical protein
MSAPSAAPDGLAIRGEMRMIYRNVRRWLAGLSKPPNPEELEPHDLTGIDMRKIREDRTIGHEVVAAEKAGARFSRPLEHKIPEKQGEGFEYFLTPDGRRCRYVGAPIGAPHTREVFFLLVRRRRS